MCHTHIAAVFGRHVFVRLLDEHDGGCRSRRVSSLGQSQFQGSWVHLEVYTCRKLCYVSVSDSVRLGKSGLLMEELEHMKQSRSEKLF